MITRPSTVQAGVTRRSLIVQFSIDVLLPLVLFYLLRQLGASVLSASLVSGAVPALRAVASLVRGRVDVLGILMLSLFAVGAAVAYIEGDPRIVFAKDGWLTGLLGIWAVISLTLRRPFMVHLGHLIATAKRGEQAAAAWERR
jgi:hypothetical protein